MSSIRVTYSLKILQEAYHENFNKFVGQKSCRITKDRKRTKKYVQAVFLTFKGRRGVETHIKAAIVAYPKFQN
jgi:hypothetical protein